VYFVPWLREAVVFGGLLVAAGLLVAHRLGRMLGAALLAVAALVGLGGPAAYAAATASAPHSGSVPTAGPTSASFGGIPLPGLAAGRFLGGPFPGGPPTFPGAPRPPLPARGKVGGLLDAPDAGPDLRSLLGEDASSFTWVAATIGANNAAGYQLATEAPVMPIGGFNGSDPSPTLAQFQQYVAEGRIHWFIGGGVGLRADSGSDVAQQIAAWVSANFEHLTVDGRSLFDLTRPLG
jgi:hypothetical protein